MPRHAVLLTDFGLSDPYAGQMKGALLRHCPDTILVDLCHQVEPYNILQAGFFLAASQNHFPEGAVFLSVVDPGVGGNRRIVLLEKYRQYFLAPDNGLLTFLLHKAGASLVRDVTPAWRGRASATFHGRDLFAPLAARILCGTATSELGAEINPHSLVRLPEAEPERTVDGVDAVVLHVDRFGNCLLNLDSEDWETVVFKGKRPALASPHEVPLLPVLTYERLEPGQVGIIKGSQGYLELAMNQDSAAQALDLACGTAVSIRIERR
ncbi:MAG: SAM-dependent chlorinase/fluorinase [Desulfovibrio sp.]|nr:SAM-dependent chlorinase/fluorinase [Desulfovibrio sp.]MBI4961534.1 SAM-dependent chlorinase/fluorinase [Desulfovibrio sp.]